MRSSCAVVALVGLALVGCAVAIPIPGVPQKKDFVTQQFVDKLNSDENSTWTAGVNDVFAGMDMKEIRESMLGLLMDRKYSVPVKTYKHIPNSEIPDSFNAYDQWPSWCHPIRDQARCGSCWAFAASEVLSDRFAIATNGSINKILSPEDMVSCDKTDNGCSGGYLDNAWEYMHTVGIVTDTCFPYDAGKGKAGKCVRACVSPTEPFVKYKAEDVYQLKTEEDIQKDIMTYGPVEAGFTVYTSFMGYKSGVYHKRIFDVPEGGHAIKIVGWGVDPPKRKWQQPQPYWLCANSWTAKWGMKGFFKIRRGTNIRGQSECDIEGNVFAGHAAVFVNK